MKMDNLVTRWKNARAERNAVALSQFLSLFNMTQSGIDGMVSYASALAIEVRNGTDGMTVSMNL